MHLAFRGSELRNDLTTIARPPNSTCTSSPIYKCKYKDFGAVGEHHEMLPAFERGAFDRHGLY